MVQIRVAVLGASGVGKSSIVNQYLGQAFTHCHEPTRSNVFYYPAIIFDDRYYQLRIADYAPIRRFPTTSFKEFDQFPGSGIRSAHVYILVFDVTRNDTFHYAQNCLSEIRKLKMPYFESEKFDRRRSSRRHNADSRKNRPLVIAASNKQDLISSDEARKRYESIVRKEWKVPYVECSAKNYWHVEALFDLLVQMVDSRLCKAQRAYLNSSHAPANTTTHTPTASVHRRHCAIM